MCSNKKTYRSEEDPESRISCEESDEDGKHYNPRIKGHRGVRALSHHAQVVHAEHTQRCKSPSQHNEPQPRKESNDLSNMNQPRARKCFAGQEDNRSAYFDAASDSTSVHHCGHFDVL
jgi:hypothetical protein